MVYNARHIRLSYLFYANSTDEIADTSLHISGGPGWDGPAAFAELTPSWLETAGQHMYTDILSQTSCNWADYSHLATVKASLINVDGTVNGDPLVRNLATPRAGSNTHVPIQCSLLLGLWSGFGAGDANYGRMYIPHTTSELAAGTPYIGAAFVSALGGYYHTFYGHINGMAQALTNQAKWCLVSKKGSGTTKDIAYTRAGRLIDTQRRRYNALAPSYTNTAV